jgi:DNA mismatch repair protein MutL
MPIKLLAPQVVSKIAAGEVVERPASVVKELVENSLDAGATSISVEARGGGINIIKVSDNGCGIPAAEVEIAFASHATSKLTSLEDLEKIATLGFRGEALPSIAAVADCEILTRYKDEDAGSYLRLVGGKIIYREKRVRQPGTTITVHHLFRHFPARLKFLKSPSTENSHIAHLLTQYALAFPEVQFSLLLEERQSLNTSGNGKLPDAVTDIYGIEISEQLLDIDIKEDGCGIKGLVSPPSLSRSNRNYLSYFINRRWVHSALLTRAVEDAYHGSLMTGKHPLAIINVTLPAQDIDVNVHPSKIEVKFRNNQLVFGAAGKAVRQALAVTTAPEIKTVNVLSAPATPISFWDKSELPAISQQMPPEPAESLKQPALPVLRVIGQLASSYIMAEGPQGLYLIDQHAAHERILFEKVQRGQREKKQEIQGLLTPLQIELSPRHEEILESVTETLNDFGITLENFGGRSYLLRAVPAVIAGSNLAEAITELLDNLAGEKEPARLIEKLAQSLACHGAVKARQPLSMEEMRELVKQLEACEHPGNCPHGRPTTIHLSSHQLEREFGRIR